MNPAWSYALAAIGVTGLYVAANRPRIGWWFNIAAQAVWLAYAIATWQWGFLASAVAYAVVYVRLLRRAYTVPARSTESDGTPRWSGGYRGSRDASEVGPPSLLPSGSFPAHRAALSAPPEETTS